MIYPGSGRSVTTYQIPDSTRDYHFLDEAYLIKGWPNDYERLLLVATCCLVCL